GDGRPDVVVACGTSVGVHLGNGSGGLGPFMALGAGSGLSWVGLADLNADGFQDLMVTDATSNQVVRSMGIGGTISPGGRTMAGAGTDRTVTMTAAPHYDLVDVRVDGASQGGVASYTFTNIPVDHALSATFIRTYDLTAS